MGDVSVDSQERRQADAELILAMVRASAEWEAATGRSVRVKPLRELMWFTWELPRLAKPLYRAKYPFASWWTPDARARFEQDGRGLVIEHVTPASVTIRRLLSDPPATVEDLMVVLDRIEYAVITDEENRLLKAAGVDSRLAPGSDDPWDRYQTAGLDRASLAPLVVEASPREAR